MLIEEYHSKKVSADEAVKHVKSGDWIEFGFFANLPLILDKALARRRDELRDVNLRGGVLMAPLDILESDPTGEHFTWNSWHFGGLDRLYAERERAYYIPLKYSELPRYLRENIKTDVVMIQVSPIDDHGYFSYGVTFSHFAAAIEKARLVIVEINEDMPRVHGGYEHNLHISEVDYIVEGGHCGIPELSIAQPTDIDRKIAEYVLPEIQNGSCIQLGIGGMPSALGQMIAHSDLKDLGVHSEMLADAFVDIVNAGKVSGKYKNMDRGRIVFTFAAGSKKLYNFMHDNPLLAAYPVNYVNNPCIASLNDNYVSINGALEIDLFGQVCSESVGPVTFSGAGGQLDFVEAAYYSKNGKSFLCLPSTYTDKLGQIHSRIKPLLTYGAVTTATRTNVQYIVTEYGMINLKGLATWQRAESIISIAHPSFREELLVEAERLKIWKRSNKLNN